MRRISTIAKLLGRAHQGTHWGGVYKSRRRPGQHSKTPGKPVALQVVGDPRLDVKNMPRPHDLQSPQSLFFQCEPRSHA